MDTVTRSNAVTQKLIFPVAICFSTILIDPNAFFLPPENINEFFCHLSETSKMTWVFSFILNKMFCFVLPFCFGNYVLVHINR